MMILMVMTVTVEVSILPFLARTIVMMTVTDKVYLHSIPCCYRQSIYAPYLS